VDFGYVAEHRCFEGSFKRAVVNGSKAVFENHGVCFNG
jgi:hypothetical protein